MTTLSCKSSKGVTLTKEQISVIECFTTLLSSAYVFNGVREDYRVHLDEACKHISLLFVSDSIFSGISASIGTDLTQRTNPCCTFPSLKFRNPSTSPSQDLPVTKSNKSKDFKNLLNVADVDPKYNNNGKSQAQTGAFEESVALNLRKPLFMNQKNLNQLPLTMLTNLTESFLLLFDSRLRLSLASFVKHQERICSTKSVESKDIASLLPQTLINVFREPGAIKPVASVAHYRIVDDEGDRTTVRSGESRFTTPIKLDFAVDLEIFGKLQTIRIDSRGSIHSIFAQQQDVCLRSMQNPPILETVSIELDTGTLLRGMMDVSRSIINVAMNTAVTIGSEMIHSYFSKEEGLRNMTLNFLSTAIDAQSEPALDQTTEAKSKSDAPGNKASKSECPKGKDDPRKDVHVSCCKEILKPSTRLIQTSIRTTSIENANEFLPRPGIKEVNIVDCAYRSVSDLVLLAKPMDGLSILSVAISNIIRPCIEHKTKEQDACSKFIEPHQNTCYRQETNLQTSRMIPPGLTSTVAKNLTTKKHSFYTDHDMKKSYDSSPSKRIKFDEEMKKATAFKTGTTSRRPSDVMYCLS